jgi:hypothetical protein
MAVDFARELLGFAGKKPNTADGSSKQSVAIAAGVLDALGVSHQAPGGQKGGALLERYVMQFLESQLPSADPTRQWIVRRGTKISEFEQYAHLAGINQLVKRDPLLRVEIGQDYIIEPDVTVGLGAGSLPLLHAAVSCKFSIRSDRVQNIRHEGVALIRHRRGRQPHIVTVTSEPLPTRLAAICRGTGEVDAAYHVCLAELREVTENVGTSEQKQALDEAVGQRRLFDLRELIQHLTV